jgi:hypothetical protein
MASQAKLTDELNRDECLGDEGLVGRVIAMAEGKPKIKQLSVPGDLFDECQASSKALGLPFNEWIVQAMRDKLARDSGLSLLTEPDIKLIEETARQLTNQVGDVLVERTAGQYAMIIGLIKEVTKKTPP